MSQRPPAWKTVATCPYVGTTNESLFFVVRKERIVDGHREKTFRQYRLDERGDKVWNLEGVSRVPYHLPELIAAVERSDTIVVTEGEKDVDNLRALGFIATTNACGATWAWTPEFTEHFRGASVIIVADNDEPGRKAARERSQAMLGVAREVRIIEDLPEVPESGDCSDLIAAGWTREGFLALFESATLVEEQPAEDGPALLDNVKTFIRRFVVMSEHALTVVALWSLHTHTIDAAVATIYLNIASPQRQCGKTLLLEVLRLLVARPFFTSRTSAAALIRKVAKDSCSLLLDETDAAFNGAQDYTEALRSILNAGNLRGGVATLCVGRNHDVQDFPVFGPKAIAGIGRLPDTIEDRSARIELSRRKRSEIITKFRVRKVLPEAEALRARIEVWAQQNLAALRETEPELPEALSGRAQDGYEPLLAIADFCGAGADARKAAVALAGTAPESENINERTLLECKRVFDDRERDRITTSDLVTELRKVDDGPFGDYRGKPFDGSALARRLKLYRIRPHDIRFESGVLKGYYRATPLETRRRGEGTFEDAWDRYSPVVSPEEQRAQHAQQGQRHGVNDDGTAVQTIRGRVAGCEFSANDLPATGFSHDVADVAVVAAPTKASMPEALPLAFDEIEGVV